MYAYSQNRRILKKERRVAMTIFAKVKASVTLKNVAKLYGMKVFRNNMICCPFHNDRHPSMKLNDDYFYCDFTARLFEISLKDAAEKLASDFGIDTDKPVESAIKPKHPMIQSLKEDENYCFNVLCEYLRLLRKWKIDYAPKTPDDEIDDRFVEACQMLCTIEHLTDVLIFEDLEIRMCAVKELLSDGKITELDERLKRIKKEEQEDEREGII